MYICNIYVLYRRIYVLLIIQLEVGKSKTLQITVAAIINYLLPQILTF